MPAKCNAHTIPQSPKNNAVTIITLSLLLVWLRLVFSVWTWTPQPSRTALVVYTDAEWDFKCRSAAASWIGPPLALVDICQGQFDLETMSSCADPELGTSPLEIVAYATAVPSPADLSIFHVSISHIPLRSHHMLVGDWISYKDDQYQAMGVATGKHTSSNGRTVVVSGQIINRVTGPVKYVPVVYICIPISFMNTYNL
jgi:hypothetical protein